MSGVTSALDLYQRGNDLFVRGQWAEAAAAYQAALADASDELAPDLYENLGLALWKLGRWRPAARALLRTLDGEPTRREQTLRVLISCLFRDGRVLDGERLLELYQARFGPHPEGWKRT